MWWSIVSKAALRSNKTSTEISLLSDAVRRSFVTFTGAVSVLWYNLNPDWKSSNKLLFSIYYLVLTFCIICWFGNASEAQKKSVRRTVTTASKLLGTTLPSLESIYRDRVTNKANAIVADERHPLTSSFKLLPSARRYCPPLFTKNRLNMSFIPQAIKLLNMVRK